MMNKNIFPIPLYLMLILFSTSCRDKNRGAADPAEQEILSSLKVVPGFKVEVIAKEPLLFDPVAMTIDEAGRLYVVEMAGMPLNKSGIGKVVLLSDTNSDGKMDKRTVFADSLIMPSGIMRWKKGVIVTDPPKVFYLEDGDGDGVSDIRRVLLSGFDTSNLEGNVNNPVYGLDNWIYLASSPGIKGGNIHFADDPAGEKLEEGTIRFQPDRHRMEKLAGNTQFGHSFDEWGNHFMLNNHFHIYQEVIAARYLQRNPDLVLPRATQLLVDHSEVYTIAKNPEYQMLTEIGVFTSACGITNYLGGAFPEEYNSRVTFVAEPASSIVHVDKLSDSGVTFKAKRIHEKKEFLASTDPHSRMVNMYVGPDGALYILDFYRQVIEGPEFMSDEVKKKTNLYNGNQKGRIYRVSAEKAQAAEWTSGLMLDKATDEKLVDYLNDRNGWWRINAQRLLVDRKSNAVLPMLRSLAGDAGKMMGRLHALWTLEGLEALTPEIILQALKDSVAGIRINAIKLAELHIKEDPRLLTALLAMENDPDIKVRYQLVCTLGFSDNEQSARVRMHILFRDIGDKWMQVAALSAGSSPLLPVLNGVLEKYDPANPAYASLVRLLAAAIGKSQPAEVIKNLVRKGLEESTSPSSVLWQTALLQGLTEGLSNRQSLPGGLEAEKKLLVRNCLHHASPDIRKNSLNLLKKTGLPSGNETLQAMKEAQKIAGNSTLHQEQRADAIDFMSLQNPVPYTDFLKGMLKPQTPVMVQLAAIRGLGAIPGVEVSKYLLGKWAALTPEVRGETINTFLHDDRRVALLLDKVEAGIINKGSISWDQSVRLRSEGSQMNRARQLLTETDSRRKEVLGEYQQALTLPGDAKKGKTIYQANCAICHQVAGKGGRALGPDLGTVHAWPQADILVNILDPNKSIALGYDMWMVKLNNGKSLQGIITAESPTAITLANTMNETTGIARQDISNMETTGMSAMPTDFETKIDQQQMADLLAFLKEIK